jgi:hypothetical protein
MFNFCEFRCDLLQVETGRWHNVSRADRLYHLCDSTDTCYIGDEYHYTVESRYVKIRLLKISVKSNVKVPF